MLWTRTGSRDQLRSSLTNTAPVAPDGAANRSAARSAAEPRTTGLDSRCGPSSRLHASARSATSAARPSRASAVTAQSDRDDASTATSAQLDGSARITSEKPSENPVTSTASSATNTIQPEEATTSITAVIRALIAPPRRDRDSAPNIAAASLDSTTTSAICRTRPGTATSTGTTPSLAANTTSAVNAAKVMSVVRPTKAVPSRPRASLRGGIGSRANCSGRRTGWPP